MHSDLKIAAEVSCIVGYFQGLYVVTVERTFAS